MNAKPTLLNPSIWGSCNIEWFKHEKNNSQEEKEYTNLFTETFIMYILKLWDFRG